MICIILTVGSSFVLGSVVPRNTFSALEILTLEFHRIFR
jgi:hypothetical protein